jgi:hypothetical protein
MPKSYHLSRGAITIHSFLRGHVCPTLAADRISVRIQKDAQKDIEKGGNSTNMPIGKWYFFGTFWQGGPRWWIS